ncbi:endonuclease/exonuclease/phosphatase family protein [uncultured Nocardioides sp.]|uniref:endonuclease/exonuclease/phosphatase family protein n=1 Tax=uncultured Nocardioides sp. TaxID=198441 RepID=UPI000C429076|nr:hypothetical protein [Nocardioides sp.]
MRIGTWNLDGRWSDRHAAVLTSLACDVLLLTECPENAELPSYASHATTARIPGEKHRHWAAIWATEPVTPLPDPHPASASVRIGDLTFCSSVLPWTLASAQWPWGPADHVGRVEEVLDALAETLGGGATVWGGDWNQPLAGNISGFSRAAQVSIAAALERHGMTAPTAEMSGRSTGQFSIDHVAVPRGWMVREVGRIVVEPALSDHDAFWVDVSVPSGC